MARTNFEATTKGFAHLEDVRNELPRPFVMFETDEDYSSGSMDGTEETRA